MFRASVLRVGFAEKLGPADQRSRGRMLLCGSGELLWVSLPHLIFFFFIIHFIPNPSYFRDNCLLRTSFTVCVTSTKTKIYSLIYRIEVTL